MDQRSLCCDANIRVAQKLVCDGYHEVCECTECGEPCQVAFSLDYDPREAMWPAGDS